MAWNSSSHFKQCVCKREDKERTKIKTLFSYLMPCDIEIQFFLFVLFKKQISFIFYCYLFFSCLQPIFFLWIILQQHSFLYKQIAGIHVYPLAVWGPGGVRECACGPSLHLSEREQHCKTYLELFVPLCEIIANVKMVHVYGCTV